MAVVEGSTLTTAQIIALVEDEHVYVDGALDLLDENDAFVQDITDDFDVAGSSIELNPYRTIHRTCELRISKELVWGSARLKPYILLSNDASTWYRWPLGVFLPNVPQREVHESPATWQVTGMDKLDVLNTPYGSSYGIDSGDAILAAVSAIITAAGETLINLNQSAAATTAPVSRVWTLADEMTTLEICNELLASIGYTSLWVDRDGYYRAQPYVTPSNRPLVWSYNANSATTTVAEYRTAIADFGTAANTIIGISDDPADSIPTAGDGLYTLANNNDGPTSINQRGGRVIRKIIRGSFANQAALVTAVTAAMDAEKRVNTYIDLTVSPNPIHSQWDAVTYRDDAMSVNGTFVVTSWRLPFDGSDMSITLRSA